MVLFIYILNTGVQWNMLPEKHGCPSTLHGKFMKWCRLGIFHKIMVKAREHYRRRNNKNNWYAFDTISKKAPLANGGKNPNYSPGSAFDVSGSFYFVFKTGLFTLR